MNDAIAVLHRDIDSVILYIPRLAGALLILVFGFGLAWLTGSIVVGILTRVGLDRLAERTGLIDDLKRVGISAHPSSIFGKLAFAIVLLAVATQAVDTLQFGPISDAMRLLLTFTPHVIIAIVVLFVGVIIGDALAQNISSAMSRSGVLYHGPAGSIVRGTIGVLAVLIALQQLTIESLFLLDVLLVVLAGGALSLGIAGGFGARSIAENLVASRYLERHLKVGDAISIGDMHATIEDLDVTSTSLRKNDGTRILIPNGTLAKETIAFHSPEAALDTGKT